RVQVCAHALGHRRRRLGLIGGFALGNPVQHVGNVSAAEIVDHMIADRRANMLIEQTRDTIGAALLTAPRVIEPSIENVIDGIFGACDRNFFVGGWIAFLSDVAGVLLGRLPGLLDRDRPIEPKRNFALLAALAIVTIAERGDAARK